MLIFTPTRVCNPSPPHLCDYTLHPPSTARPTRPHQPQPAGRIAMASAIFFGATSGGVLVAAGAAAHGVLASRQLSGKRWDTSGRGGFIGSIRGAEPSPVPPLPQPVPGLPKPATPPPSSGGAAKAPAASAGAAAAGAGKSVVKSPRDAPIGGATGKASPPTPFGIFRKHKPTKLPKGCPKPYDASKSP